MVLCLYSDRFSSFFVHLQLYTMAGRRSQLSMVLGSPAAFMDCNQGWRLLVVTKAGSLHLWDLQESKLLLHESLSPLLSLSSSPNANSKGNGTGLNRFLSSDSSSCSSCSTHATHMHHSKNRLGITIQRAMLLLGCSHLALSFFPYPSCKVLRLFEKSFILSCDHARNIKSKP